MVTDVAQDLSFCYSLISNELRLAACEKIFYWYDTWMNGNKKSADEALQAYD